MGYSIWWETATNIILPCLLLHRVAFVPDGVSNNGRFEAERPPASVGPPSGDQAATSVSFV